MNSGVLSKSHPEHTKHKVEDIVKSLLVSFTKDWPRTSVSEELCTHSTQTSHIAKLPQILWHKPVYQLSQKPKDEGAELHNSYKQAHFIVLLVVIWSRGKPESYIWKAPQTQWYMHNFSIFLFQTVLCWNEEILESDRILILFPNPSVPKKNATFAYREVKQFQVRPNLYKIVLIFILQYEYY
jgi:hypothetical protein